MSSAGKCECGEPLIYGDSNCSRCGKEVAYKFTSSTPTPGAASELLSRMAEAIREIHVAAFADREPCTTVESLTAWLRTIVGPLMVDMEKAAAPVTEGAQREAVAMLPLNQVEAVAKQECLQATDSLTRDVGGAIYRRLMMRLRMLTSASPPPPDRVQPERVEAPIEFEQTASRIVQQFDLPPQASVLLMVAIVTALREAAAPASPTDASDNSTNSTAIDSSLVVSPTDAIGGVTGGLNDPVFAFLLGAGEIDGKWFGDKNATDKPFWWRENLRRALEAADRARKQGEEGVDESRLKEAYDDANAICNKSKVDSEIERRASRIRAFLRVWLKRQSEQHIGAVIPDAGRT